MSDNTIDYERAIGRTVIGGAKGAAIGTLVSAFSIAVGYAFSLPWHVVAGSAVAAFLAPVMSCAIQAMASSVCPDDHPESTAEPNPQH